MSDATAVSAPKKPSWGKRILIAFAVLVVVLLLLVLAAPTLLSTGAGKSFILGKVNGSIPGKVDAGAISLSWFSGQRMDTITVTGPAGDTVLSADSIDIPGASLWALVRGSHNVGTIKLVKPFVKLDEGADGRMAIVSAFVKPAQPGETTPPSKSEPAGGASEPWRVAVEITDGKVTYSGAKVEPMVISNLQLTADANDWQSLAATLKADIEQNKEKGSINLSKISADKLFDANGKLADWKTAVYTLVGKIDKLPTTPVMKLASGADKYAPLIGKSLTLDFDVKGDLKSINGKIATSNDQPLFLNLAVGATDKSVELAAGPASLVRLNVTPEAWAKLTAGADGKATSTLNKPFTIEAKIPKLRAPRKGEGIDLAATAAAVDITITDIDLTGDQNVGRVTLTRVHLTGDTAVEDSNKKPVSDALAKGARVKLVATASQQRPGDAQPVAGTIDLDVSATDLLTDDLQLNHEKLAAKVLAKIARLPLAAVDQIAQTDGLLSELGKTLDATLEGDFKQSKSGVTGEFSLVTTTTAGTDKPPLDGRFHGVIDDSDLTLVTNEKEGDRNDMIVVVSPSLAARYLAPKGSDSKLRLVSAVPVKLAIKSLRYPKKGDAFDLAGLTLDAELIPQTSVTLTDPDKFEGQVELRDLRIAANTRKNDKGELQGLSSGLLATVSTLSRFGADEGRLDANADVSQLFGKDGKLDGKNAAIALVAKLTKFPTAPIDAIAKKDGLIGLAMGPSVESGTLTYNAMPDDKGAVKKTFTSNIESTGKRFVLTNLKGSLEPNRVTFDRDTKIELTATPALLAALQRDKANPNKEPGFALAENSRVAVTLGAIEIPLPAEGKKFDTGAIRIGLTGTIDQLVPAKLPKGVTAKLQSIKFSKEDGRLGDDIKIALDAAVLSDGKPGSLRVYDTKISKLFSDSGMTVNANAELRDVPSALVDAIASKEGDPAGKYSSLLGDRIDSALVKAVTDPGKPVQFDVTIVSPLLKTSGLKGSFDSGKAIALSPGGAVDMTLTPRAFALWTAPTPASTPPSQNAAEPVKLVLMRDWPLKLTVNKCDVKYAAVPKDAKEPPKGLAAFDWANTKLALSLTSDGVGALKAEEAQPAEIAGLVASVSTDNLLQLVTATIKAGNAANAASGAVVIDATANVTGLALDKEGSLDMSKANVVFFDGKKPVVVKLPTQLLDSVSAMMARKKGSANMLPPGMLAGLLGEQSTLNVAGNYSLDEARASDIDLALDSGNAKLRVPASIKTGTMTLRGDAPLSLALTPTLRDVFLKKMINIVDPTSAEKPFQFTVMSKGFSMPVKDFDIAKLNSDIKVDLGAINVSKRSLVGFALGLKQIAQQAGKGGDERDIGALVQAGVSLLDRENKLAMNAGAKPGGDALAKFQPTVVNMSGGVVKYDSLPFSVEEFDLDGHGAVDLKNGTRSIVGVVKGISFERIGAEKYFDTKKDMQLNFTGGINDNVGDDKIVGEGLRSAAVSVASKLGGDKAGGAGKLIGDILGGGKKEPEKPADPKAPTTPTDPKKPMSPTDPKAPAAPSDPKKPAAPADPKAPPSSDPKQPAQSTKPEEKKEPTLAERLAEIARKKLEEDRKKKEQEKQQQQQPKNP